MDDYDYFLKQIRSTIRGTLEDIANILDCGPTAWYHECLGELKQSTTDPNKLNKLKIIERLLETIGNEHDHLKDLSVTLGSFRNQINRNDNE